MRYSPQKIETEEFAMAPMIDMVFLLLVFFMCVSVWAKAHQQVDVNLPKSTESQIDALETAKIVITIQKGGEIYLSNQLVLLSELKTMLKEQATERVEDLKIDLRIDETVVYENVQPILKLFASLGFPNIAYTTLRPR